LLRTPINLPEFATMEKGIKLSQFREIVVFPRFLADLDKLLSLAGKLALSLLIRTHDSLVCEAVRNGRLRSVLNRTKLLRGGNSPDVESES
jgi:hypothetical protein